MQNMVEQWISFLPDGERGSNISIWLEINGRTPQVLGRDVVEVVREFKQEWYRRLAQRCDELTLERKDRRRA